MLSPCVRPLTDVVHDVAVDSLEASSQIVIVARAMRESLIYSPAKQWLFIPIWI